MNTLRSKKGLRHFSRRQAEDHIFKLYRHLQPTHPECLFLIGETLYTGIKSLAIRISLKILINGVHPGNRITQCGTGYVLRKVFKNMAYTYLPCTMAGFHFVVQPAGSFFGYNRIGQVRFYQPAAVIFHSFTESKSRVQPGRLGGSDFQLKVHKALYILLRRGILRSK